MKKLTLNGFCTLFLCQVKCNTCPKNYGKNVKIRLLFSWRVEIGGPMGFKACNKKHIRWSRKQPTNSLLLLYQFCSSSKFKAAFSYSQWHVQGRSANTQTQFGVARNRSYQNTTPPMTNLAFAMNDHPSVQSWIVLLSWACTAGEANEQASSVRTWFPPSSSWAGDFACRRFRHHLVLLPPTWRRSVIFSKK